MPSVCRADQMNLWGNSPLNSLHPSIKSDLEMRRKEMHILIQYHNIWAKRHSWNDHMLYSISIKTMAPQSAVIAWDLSYEEEEGGTDHMYVCMPLWMPAWMCACLSALTPQEEGKERDTDLWCCFINHLKIRPRKRNNLKHLYNSPRPHTYIWWGVVCLAVCVLKRTCKSLKAKHPEWQRKGETCKSIYMFPGGVWCYALLSNRSWFLSSKLPREWMGREKIQDISCTPETNCINIFLGFKGMFLLMSCELVIRLCDWSLLSHFSLPDAYCLIHSNTHLHRTLASSSVRTHFLSDSLTSTESQKEQRGEQMPPNKIQMEFHMRCLGATSMVLLLKRKKQKCGCTHIFQNWRINSLFRQSGLGDYNVLLIQWFRPLTEMEGF